MAFLGHFHPVLVHLPIGVLLTALLLQALSRNVKYAHLGTAVPIVLLAGFISAALSCITGYLLSQGGEYDPVLVSRHMWMGIGLTCLSLVLYLQVVYSRKRGRPLGMAEGISGILLFLFILVTGHLGGSLTHGTDYLAGSLTDKEGAAKKVVYQPIANVQEAKAYEEVVRPILQAHCYNCHGPAKQKGGLRLDNMEAIMKGGKDGVALIPGNASGSELIKRLQLPLEDEHHMPPKEKGQLGKGQLDLLNWWVGQGADCCKKVKELQQEEKIRPLLAALQGPRSGGNDSSEESDAVEKKLALPAGIWKGLPVEGVPPADDKVIRQLTSKGVLVMPLARGYHQLQVNFVAVPGPLDPLLPLLASLKKQLVSLDLNNRGVNDSALRYIGACTELRSLGLSNSNITDKGLGWIQGLKELRVINLAGAKVTASGLGPLRSLKQLQAVYLYHTGVRDGDWSELKKAFPGVMLDSGGYTIPVLATDTAIVRPQAATKK